MASLTLRRLYAPEYMIRPSLRRGELPDARTAYATAMGTAWASIAESFLIALITMVDTVMVSAVSAAAVAAVGLTMQPRFIVITPVMALCVAVTSVAARRRGENDMDGAVRCLKQGLILTAGLSTIPAIIALAAWNPLLRFAGAMEDTIGPAGDYFRIIMIATPACCLAMTISASLRGIGKTRTAMIINMTSNGINMLFNYLLIGGNWGFPALGVKGAAIATAIGWHCGLIIALLAVTHRQRDMFILEREGWRFERRTLRALYIVGSGSIIEMLCMRVGFLAYAKVVAGLGTMMFATHQICINIMNLSFSVGEGFGVASTSLVGRNLGAKRPDLSLVYGKVCQRMAFCCCVGLFFVFTLGGESLIRIFREEAEIIETGKVILVLMGVIVFAQCSQMIIMGSLRGAGDTRYTAMVSLISVMLIRPPLAYFLAYKVGLGLVGAWCAFMVDQYLRLLLTMLRFSSGKWMNIEL